MSRIVTEDFNKLKQFINAYSISGVLTDQKILELISLMHKKYFAYIAIIYEIQDAVDSISSPLFNDKQKSYLKESVSDTGNSFFLTINGAYKPAKLILRSSIETFLKAIGLEEHEDIDKEKSLFKIFELISELDFFQIELPRQTLKKLKDTYSTLSADTHTATVRHMQQTSSLNYFPMVSVTDIRLISVMYTTLITSYLIILSLKFNFSFHKIHHINKAIIINQIPREIRPIVMNII